MLGDAAEIALEPVARVDEVLAIGNRDAIANSRIGSTIEATSRARSGRSALPDGMLGSCASPIDRAKR